MKRLLIMACLLVVGCSDGGKEEPPIVDGGGAGYTYRYSVVNKSTTHYLYVKNAAYSLMHGEKIEIGSGSDSVALIYEFYLPSPNWGNDLDTMGVKLKKDILNIIELHK